MSDALKHTPGPWYPVHNGYYWDIKLGPEKYAQGVGDTGSSKYIHISDDVIEDHGEANARLMAAAPELLEALKREREELNYSFSTTQPQRIKEIDALLDKVEGRTE